MKTSTEAIICLLFLDTCHFGDIGNKIIAESLFDELKPKFNDIIKKRLKKV